MRIEYNQEKFESFNQVVFNQDFIQYRGMTSMYSAFEAPNLPPEIKLSLLKKLSVTNHLALPNFEKFWVWIKEKHGTELSTMLAKFIAPGDQKLSTHLKNAMRSNKSHDLWMHIKARVYKKWCSIVTEMQCVYAIVEGVKDKGLNWTVLTSPQLDSIGIDFAILVVENNEKVVYPFQIKKDSYNVYAQQKHNAKENFEIVAMKKKPTQEMEVELKNVKMKATIMPLTILKYGLAKNNKLPYEYLDIRDNGFVYYHPERLVNEIQSHLQKFDQTILDTE